MSLNQHLNKVLELLLEKPAEIITNESLIHCIDLTLLSLDCSTKSLIQLNQLANQHSVAALCVYPNDLAHLKAENETRLATVVNFPHGNEEVSTCLNKVDQALSYGVQEIDYVVPYSLYISGKKKQALEHANQVISYCQKHQLQVKVILESGAFQDLTFLYELARELIEMNVDFLKTSTGKIDHGASPSAAITLLSAIKDSEKNCGIKISGGVKTPEQARSYAYLAQLMLDKPISSLWFRIGASSLLDDLIKTI